MSSTRPSPFAALSGFEKQIKWLEYQSVRLPYVQANAEAPLEEQEKEPSSFHREPEQVSAKAVRSVRQEDALADKADLPQERRAIPELQGQETAAAAFRRTRHHQYDAVIERMKQAEKKVGHYQTLP